MDDEAIYVPLNKQQFFFVRGVLDGIREVKESEHQLFNGVRAHFHLPPVVVDRQVNEAPDITDEYIEERSNCHRGCAG